MTRAVRPQHLKYLISVGLSGLLALAVRLTFVVFQGAAQAVTFNVDSTGDGSDTNLADGICATATGDCTLRAAIEQAGSGDAINIPLGVYTLTLGTELTIDQNLALTGAGSGDTIIQAAVTPGVATHRVLAISGDASASISGLTIQNGRSLLDAGGIENRMNATLNITNSTVTDNIGESDGGDIWNQGTLTLTNSVVTGTRRLGAPASRTGPS